MSKNKLLYRFQSGFWKNYSTTLVLDISVISLKYLGFSKNTVTWFKSYLCERKFKIRINTSYSSPSNLLCGVRQWSILGPLLFLLYIDDFPGAVVSDSLLYSDDTCIVFQHKSEIEIEKQLIRDFLSLCDCFVDNKFSIHFEQDKNKINIIWY